MKIDIKICKRSLIRLREVKRKRNNFRRKIRLKNWDKGMLWNFLGKLRLSSWRILDNLVIKLIELNIMGRINLSNYFHSVNLG